MITEAPGSGRSNPLRASAHELQRAAGAIQKHAGHFETLAQAPATLAHVEEALDRLENALYAMAGAAAEWTDHDDAAEALRRHLLEAAATLQSAGAACGTGRHWTRRLLDSIEEREEAQARPAEAPAPDAIPLCAGEGVRLHAVVDELTLTYEVVCTGEDSDPRRLAAHVRTLRDARRLALAHVESLREARALPAPGAAAADPG